MSILFIKKFSAKKLVNIYSNIFIRAAKAIDVRVIKIKTLEHWQGLKVYKMRFIKYLREEKIKLFCQEIE